MLPKNDIHTSKYTAITFIPHNLLNQFQKAPNIYFLLICFMQVIPSISISAGKPAMALPLFFVVLVSMIKDAFEDYKRHQSDNKENNTSTRIYDPKAGAFIKEEWKNLHVGQIVKIADDEFAPCDILLLNSSDPKGICYVETKNLDGETNLKIKTVQKDLSYLYKVPDDFRKLDGQLLCERPNNAIYKFEGQLKIQEVHEKISLCADNLMLRGSSLKNTEYVYGIAVFTGHDTKIMMNSAAAKYKFSSLEKLMNKALVVVFILQIVLALVAASVGTHWDMQYSNDAIYLDYTLTIGAFNLFI